MSIQARWQQVVLGAALASAMLACAPGQKDREPPASQGVVPVASAPKAGGRPTVLFIGTSLTAGLGLPSDQAYPALVERLAADAGVPITAVNAGVSGETSAGALHRIDWVLRTPADLVVLETGANDGLRGLLVSAAKDNISEIIDRIHKAKPGVPVVLVQMEAPRNMGTRYSTAFHDLYGEVAQEKRATLLRFLLDSVAGHAELNQEDGLHPNTEGERIVARNVWRGLEPIVRGLGVQPQP